MINSRRTRWAGHVECMRENGNTCSVLMSGSAGKKPLRRPRSRWENDIKMGIGIISTGRLNWLKLSNDSKK
jgi:hypothetical protein